MRNQKKVLVTGVAGFIGSNLASRLLAEGYEVLGIDNLAYGLRENVPHGVEFHLKDIRSKDIFPLFKGIDTVFHLAAKNCISDCQADPVETAEINVSGTVNVFEASKRAGVRKVIYAESSALYEGSSIYPTPESELKPESFYAVSKLASIHFAKAYETFYGLCFTGLRYFCVYGPVQDYRRTIPPVMSAFIIKLLRGERPIIYGTGEKRRDFVYVDDVNDFHLICIRDDRTNGSVFNIGSGTNYSVNEILDKISKILGANPSAIYKDDLPGEAQVTLADIRQARALGWEPKTPIEAGLEKTIEYIRQEMAAGRIP
ncbi:MAG: NAD-dependent epimerase/dehydratase family protein [Syntrophaceae bacterium]|nr:NAD-dependent epimerase/dehydratase family protein [Syntrophaceae bacterium]